MMTPSFLELALLPFWWPQMQNLTKHLKTLSTHLWLLTQSPFSMEVTHSPVNAQLMRTLEGSFVCSRPFPLPEAQTSSDLYSLMLTPKWNVLLFSKPEGMLVGSSFCFNLFIFESTCGCSCSSHEKKHKTTKNYRFYLSEFSMIYDPKRLLYKHKASLVKEITHLYLPGK